MTRQSRRMGIVYARGRIAIGILISYPVHNSQSLRYPQMSKNNHIIREIITSAYAYMMRPRVLVRVPYLMTSISSRVGTNTLQPCFEFLITVPFHEEGCDSGYSDSCCYSATLSFNAYSTTWSVAPPTIPPPGTYKRKCRGHPDEQ
jgi:hypothetical protein